MPGPQLISPSADTDSGSEMDMDLESEEGEGDNDRPAPAAASRAKAAPRTAAKGVANPYPLEGKYLDEDDRDE
jgi:RNA polymerase-associated protein RTF1